MRNRNGCSSPNCMTRLRACLGCPASVRFRTGGDVFDPPGGERDEEEDIDPLHEDGLDGQEVAGQHARRLRSQERSPRRARSLWCRLEAFIEQHLAYGRRRNQDAETLELTDDPFVAPVRVLGRESHDQLAQRALKRRSSGAPVGVCPAARDELAVPAKQRLRLEREDGPGRPAQRAGQRRQQRAISPRQLRPRRLSAEDRKLVAEDENLQLLRATPLPQQPHQREQVPDNEIHKRPKQSVLPRPRQQNAEPSEPSAPREPRTSLRTLRARPDCLATCEEATARQHAPAATSSAGTSTNTKQPHEFANLRALHRKTPSRVRFRPPPPRTFRISPCGIQRTAPRNGFNLIASRTRCDRNATRTEPTEQDIDSREFAKSARFVLAQDKYSLEPRRSEEHTSELQ